MKVVPVQPREDFIKYLKKTAEYDLTGFEGYIEREHVVEITEDQADQLDDAAAELYQMCLAAVDKVCRDDLFEQFGYTRDFGNLVRASWDRGQAGADAGINPHSTLGVRHDPTLAGRMDLWWDGHQTPKFFEFNADTPVTQYECAVVQWAIVQDLQARGQIPARMVQFNLLQEKMVEQMAAIRQVMVKDRRGNRLHVSCYSSETEDLNATNYVAYMAKLAGLETRFVEMEQIGTCLNPADLDFGKLYDDKNNEIKALYKMMPWEHMMEGEYAPAFLKDRTLMIEPSWRALLSNKMLSVMLWDMFPDHPLLLPTYTTPEPFDGNYVEKPIFGRVGAAVTAVVDGVRTSSIYGEGEAATISDEDMYKDYPKVFQELRPLPKLAGGLADFHVQTSAWIVGDGDVAGMDLRIDRSMVTGSKDIRFLPHYMIPHQ